MHGNVQVRAENHFYECINSGRQRGTLFHIKPTYMTPLKGENAVIYKDFEGALSTKNESHSSM